MVPVVTRGFGASVKGSSIFVTGAHGLLGSWLCGRLLDLGGQVTVLRREPQPGSALVITGNEARCQVVDGDLLDSALLEEVVAAQGIDTVVHLAAQAIVGVARTSPRSTFEANVVGTWNVLEASRLAGVGRVVVASSDKAYGPSDVLPYVEDLPLRAQFPYDASKAAADLIARSYWHTYDLPVVVTRLANLYGGGDQNQSRLVPEAMAAVERIEGWRSLGDNIIETIINKSEKVKDIKTKARTTELTDKEKKTLTEEEKEYKSKRKQVQEKLIKFATGFWASFANASVFPSRASSRSTGCESSPAGCSAVRSPPPVST